MIQTRLSALLVVAVLLVACAEEAPPTATSEPLDQTANAQAAEAAALSKLMDDYWALRLEEDPILAAQLGDDDARGRLPDLSLEGHQAGVSARRSLLDRLEELDPTGLDPDDDLNYRLLKLELENAVAADADKGKYLVISSIYAPHVDLARVADITAFRDRDDVAFYLERLAGIGPAMNGLIARLDEAVEVGWTQPCAPLAAFGSTYQTHIVDDPSRSVFMKPFRASSLPTAEQNDEALRLIGEEVIPAYQALGTFFESRYITHCRKEAGLGSLDGGPAHYAQLARFHTTTSMTPDAIHQTGLDEVARIKKEMEDVAGEAGFETLADFQKHLRTDPQYYPKTALERIEKASTIAKTMDGKLVDLFTLMPRMPYDIRPIPMDIAEGTTTAYYSAPAADGTRPGTYWINTTQLNTRPLYELEALTLHEAVPGHHFQIALAQELDLPPFRRFAMFTAYIEGWGLYSERLGMEVGFYATPATNFGRLSYEMWRACRLVVDTGIHAKGWTRQEAIDFMVENTGLSRNNIEREVNRYITYPGQALAYKIGELKIRALRARAEEELSDRFDVRRFNDAILAEGALPLSILEERMVAWIAEEQPAR